jgi:hypothetical protein
MGHSRVVTSESSCSRFSKTRDPYQAEETVSFPCTSHKTCVRGTLGTRYICIRDSPAPLRSVLLSDGKFVGGERPMFLPLRPTKWSCLSARNSPEQKLIDIPTKHWHSMYLHNIQLEPPTETLYNIQNRLYTISKTDNIRCIHIDSKLLTGEGGICVCSSVYDILLL